MATKPRKSCKRGLRKGTKSCKRKSSKRKSSKRKSSKRKTSKRKSSKRKSSKRKSSKRKPSRKMSKRKSKNRKYRMESCESYKNNTGKTCPKCCSAHKGRCKWMGKNVNPSCQTISEDAIASRSSVVRPRIQPSVERPRIQPSIENRLENRLEQIRNEMTERLESDILSDNVDIDLFKRFFLRKYVQVFNMRPVDINSQIQEVITGRTSDIVLDYLRKQIMLEREEQLRIQEEIMRKMSELNLSDDEGEGEKCMICFDYLDNGERTVELNCGHIFHRDCLLDYRDRGEGSGRLLCPTCRQSYDEEILF